MKTIKVNEKRYNNDENPILLLGVKHKGDTLLNPKISNFSGLEENDSLIVMPFKHVKIYNNSNFNLYFLKYFSFIL